MKGGVSMKNYIEFKVAEYPEITEQGLAWVVIYKIIYLQLLIDPTFDFIYQFVFTILYSN